ncbi:MAG: CpaF family protein [Planctomycetaceae bacterium]|nr:CpaF family protein [Planctomycetales bacterium]MCB9874476.1 CpaF family protein [Planctomycetaceae bacterium]HRX78074.1 CpaF family protein [Pirellulaceae bacterium]
MTREAIFEASVGYFLSPIVHLLDDDSVTEIMVNRFDQVYIERAGQLYETEARFETEDALLSAVHNIAQWVGRKINQEHPILDARLPDGSRVHAIIPPGCRAGTCLTIRKFKLGGLSLEDLIQFGSLNEEAREFLEICVRLRKNIIVSGGTGTGKTSLLGAVTTAVPEEERIIVIEDTSELKLRQKHCVYLEVQRPDQYGRGELTIRQLFVASLRMRPDRIIVGEVRGGEALDMLQAMLSGHSGSLTTVHANSARDALVRLETLSMMSDVEIPVHVARAQVASAIDLIVQLDRYSEDGSRKISRITEVIRLDEQGQYETQDIFECHLTGKSKDGRLIGNLAFTGQPPTFAKEPVQHGMRERIKHSSKVWASTGSRSSSPGERT